MMQTDRRGQMASTLAFGAADGVPVRGYRHGSLIDIDVEDALAHAENTEI